VLIALELIHSGIIFYLELAMTAGSNRFFLKHW